MVSRAAAETGTPFDYPLSSRFDENDAIIVFDKVLIPWENVLVYKDLDKLKAFYPRSGFFNGFTFQACTRLAVKMDFMAGVLNRALEASGTKDFRGVQVLAVTRYLPELGLGFVVKLDRSEAFKSMRNIRNILLLVLVVALVALELTFLTIQRSMLKPIQR